MSINLLPSCAYYVRRLIKKTADTPSIPDLLQSADAYHQDVEDRLQFLYANSSEKVVLHLEKLIYSHQHARTCQDQIALQDITNRILWWLGYGITMQPANAKIFIVDDTLETLKLVTTLLTKAGYKTHSALNGKLALAQIPSLEPDLILLDVNLPDIDGYQVYKKLQEFSATANIPVIFLSGVDSLNSIHGPNKSRVGYLPKPFKPHSLIKHVNRYLQLHLSGDTLPDDVLTHELASRQKYAQKFLYSLHGPGPQEIGHGGSYADAHYFFRATLDGRYLRVSQAFAQLHGYGSGEDMISSVTNLWTQIYSNVEHQEKWMTCLQCPNETKTFGTKIKTKDDRHLNATEEISLIQDGYGRNLFYQGSIRLI